MAHITPSTDNDDFGDAPIPNPALDALRKQMKVTTRMSFMSMVASLLGLSLFALPGGMVTLVGMMVTLLTVATFLIVAIIVKTLFVIRGGTLTFTDLARLGLQIWFLLPTAVAFVYLLIAAIEL